MKDNMHSYVLDAPINLLLNFKFEELVKRETSLCDFAKVGLKGGENIWKKCNVLVLVRRILTEVLNASQFLENLHVGLSLKRVPKYSFKF